MNCLEKEKQKLAQILKSQTAITDELILREPEKVKKFKRQRNEMMAAKEKLEEDLDRMKIDGDKMREVIVQQSNEFEKLMDELKHATMEKKHKDIQNGELKEENKLLKRALEQGKIEDAAMKESCRQMKNQIHQLEYEKASLEKDSAQKQIIISKFKEDLKSMEDCILEKDIEIWNLKQGVEEAGDEVVNSVVSMAIKIAVKTEEDDVKFQSLLKKNAALSEKVEMLIHEKEELQGQRLILESCVVESEERFKEASTKIEIEKERLKEAGRDNSEAQDRIKELGAALQDADMHATEAERRLKDAEQEKELLRSNFKELAKANIDLLQVNRKMNYEFKAQEERLIDIDEKFHDIVNMCSEERQKNKMLIEQLKSVENQMKEMEDLINENKKKKKSLVRRFISRFKNNV